MKKGIQVTLIVILILLIDQILKIYIKTNFFYGQEQMLIGKWARLYFIENDGMAYGKKFSDLPFIGKHINPGTAKLSLTIFRIFAVGFIISIVRKMIQKSTVRKGAIYCMALILAGAIGNIIDCVFYGKIFSNSPHNNRSVAELFPDGGGYEGWFRGYVVDMFYFPMIQTTLPEWVPFKGGEYFEFFRPVFNVADASISVGIFLLLVFYREVFNQK